VLVLAAVTERRLFLGNPGPWQP